MDRIVYDRMAEHDSTHWWYVARRDILADFIAREVQLPEGARILEIGCGTGHNLPMLGAFGEVDAIEIDSAAREIASKRLGKEVGSAPLPELPARLPVLLVTGALDQIAPPSALKPYGETRTVKVVDGADHGWWPGVDELAGHLTTFVKALPGTDT